MALPFLVLPVTTVTPVDVEIKGAGRVLRAA